MDMEYIRAQLQRRSAERQLGRVAGGSAVPLRTIHRIIKGGCNPRYNTLSALEGFLRETEKQRKLAAAAPPAQKEKA